jgi:ABC-2 type transport system ATP-binding protein
LIRERNQEGATVILVTHNVLEAEQVVDRVAVINHGKLLAVDHVSQLKQRVDQRLKLEVTTKMGQSEEVRRYLGQWGVLFKTGENRFRLLIEKGEAGPLLDRLVEEREIPIDEFSLVPPNLEDVYFHNDQDTNEKEKETVGHE